MTGHNLRDITVFFSANSENLILSLFSAEKLFAKSSSDTRDPKDAHFKNVCFGFQ